MFTTPTPGSVTRTTRLGQAMHTPAGADRKEISGTGMNKDDLTRDLSVGGGFKGGEGFQSGDVDTKEHSGKKPVKWERKGDLP